MTFNAYIAIGALMCAVVFVVALFLPKDGSGHAKHSKRDGKCHP